MRKDIRGRIQIVPWGKKCPKEPPPAEEFLVGPSLVREVIYHERLPSEALSSLAEAAKSKEGMKRPEKNKFFRLLQQLQGVGR